MFAVILAVSFLSGNLDISQFASALELGNVKLSYARNSKFQP